MKKKLFLISLICLLVALSAIIYRQFQSYEQSEYIMDTLINISANGKDSKAAVQSAIDEIYRIDSLMNSHSKSSEIYSINSAKKGTAVKVSDEVFNLINTSLDISKKTYGAFDISIKPLCDIWNIKSEQPHIPTPQQILTAKNKTNYTKIKLDKANKTVTLPDDGMGIDLGGIAKGYAANRAAEIMHKYKIKSALINLGGNIYAIGKKKNNENWRIGIQKPFETQGEYFKTLSVCNTSVVTSGAYERYFEKNGKIYHHILNPKTGYPSESDVKSATVICKDSVIADALSTSVFILGTQKAKDIKRKFKNIQIIILTDDGKVLKY